MPEAVVFSSRKRPPKKEPAKKTQPAPRPRSCGAARFPIQPMDGDDADKPPAQVPTVAADDNVELARQFVERYCQPEGALLPTGSEYESASHVPEEETPSGRVPTAKRSRRLKRGLLFGKSYNALGTSEIDPADDAGDDAADETIDLDRNDEEAVCEEPKAVYKQKGRTLRVVIALGVALTVAVVVPSLLTPPAPRIHYLANQGYRCALEGGGANVLTRMAKAGHPHTSATKAGQSCWEEAWGLVVAESAGQCTFMAEYASVTDVAGRRCLTAVRFCALPVHGLAVARDNISVVTCVDLPLPDA